MNFFNLVFIVALLGVFGEARAKNSDNFVEIELNRQNCEKIIEGRCVFRDQANSGEAYFHATKLIIFQGKIMAFQDYNNTIKIFKIKDSNYKLLTKRGNLVKFRVENGVVFGLRALKGNLANEGFATSNCKKTQFLYDFYQIYDVKKFFVEEYGFYDDEFDFSSLKEFLVFAPKFNQQSLMAMSSHDGKRFRPIKRLKLCKFPGEDKALVKHINAKKDCVGKGKERFDECRTFRNCINYLIVEGCKVVYFRGF